MLKPVEKPLPEIKSDDPEFNAEYAQRVLKSLNMLDPDEAAVLAELVVGDILEEIIEKNQRTLQRYTNECVLRSIDEIKKSMKKVAISKGAVGSEETAYMDAIYRLEEIVKADDWESREHPRGRTGQFTRKLSASRDVPAFKDSTAQRMGIKGATSATYRSLSDEEKAKYQQEYMQVASFLQAVGSGSQLGEKDVRLHIRNKGGDTYTKPVSSLRPGIGDWNPREEEVVGVEAKPAGVTVGGASFGLTNAVGGNMSPGRVKQIDRGAGSFPGFQQAWNKPLEAGDRSSNARLYQKIGAGSKLLNDVSNDPNTQFLGYLGQFVGSHGPEAEKVFGPSLRRAAYRYRGTERTPDSEMVELYSRSVRRESKQSADLSEEERRTLRIRQNRALTRAREQKAIEINRDLAGDMRRITGTKVEEHPVKNLRRIESQRAGVPIEAITLDKDERAQAMNAEKAKFMEERNARTAPVPTALEAGREQIANHLWEKRPDSKLFGLHLESGNTPPSEGVMLDSNGRIVAQAIGYGDDHYLPFNLKNMKSLKGGEYIRTRSVGGPTSEDIYTGLVMGARRVEVISRSGRFVVEFDDDFRGGRRYNDKARRMTRRYEQLLDAVQSEQVDRMGVSADVKAGIAADVDTKFPGMSAADKKKVINTRIEEYKASPEMTPADEAAFEAHMRNVTGEMTDRQASKIRADALNSWRNEKEFKFRLNGVGYGAALKALEEQFPYYIKTHDRPVNDQAERASFEPDKGYVQPGRLRPAAAAAGLHGVKHRYRAPEGSGKFSAEDADFPVGRDRVRTEAAAPTNGEKKPENGEKNGKTPDEKLKEAGARMDYADVAFDLAQKIKRNSPNWDRDRAVAPAILGFMDREDLREHLATPEGYSNMERMLQSYSDEFTRLGFLDSNDLMKYRRSSGAFERKPASPTLLYATGQPQQYNEPAYKAGATKEQVNEELKKYGETPSITTGGKNLAKLSPQELEHEIQVLGRLNQVEDSIQGMSPDALYTALENQWKIQLTNEGAYEIATNRPLRDAHAEKVQRMRALMDVREDKPKTAVTETKTVREAPTTPAAIEENAARTKDNASRLADYHDVLGKAVDKAREEGKHPAYRRRFQDHRDRLTNVVMAGERIEDDEMEGLEKDDNFMNAVRDARAYIENRQGPHGTLKAPE